VLQPGSRIKLTRFFRFYTKALSATYGKAATEGNPMEGGVLALTLNDQRLKRFIYGASQTSYHC
jgi:hypothetical protein